LAFRVNQTTQNIGARRLYTVLEHLLEELSFAAPEMEDGKIEITPEYVTQRLQLVVADEDLSRFIL
jgi:ATP-dependent HslUV protease ATP-binding subunit HslU